MVLNQYYYIKNNKSTATVFCNTSNLWSNTIFIIVFS